METRREEQIERHIMETRRDERKAVIEEGSPPSSHFTYLCKILYSCREKSSEAISSDSLSTLSYHASASRSKVRDSSTLAVVRQTFSGVTYVW